MANKILLTDQGFQKLTKELEDLKTKRDQLIARIEEVAQPDESCEDGLATQLKEELEVINDRIDFLDDSVANAEIVSHSHTKSAVAVGSRVKIKISGKVEKEFHIVSEVEADPTQNMISDQSPLGQALVGKKIDDEIEFEAPVGRLTYKIVAIG